MKPKYRTANHFNRCLCGQPAVKWKDGGFVCARCLRIEEQQEMTQLRKCRAGVADDVSGSWTMRRFNPNESYNQSFVCRIIEKAHELVVIGEGEHHLKLV